MAPKKKRRSPSKSVRSLRSASLGRPPRPAEFDRRAAVQAMTLTISGVEYLIGPAVQGDPQIEGSIDESEVITVAVADTDGTLTAALAHRDGYMVDGARIRFDGCWYVLLTASSDETGRILTLSFEDEAAWRMRERSSFRAFSRASHTRPQAVLRLVQEAGTAPRVPISYWIPELRDKQPIAPRTAEQRKAGTKAASVERGTGSSAKYKVKGETATGAQKRNIDTILGRAKTRGASRMVMVGAIAGGTQESTLLASATNGVHVGIYQQKPNYGTVTERRNVEHAIDGFLNEWKRVHGSIKKCPGGVVSAVEKVQRSGQGSEVGKWVDEATETVDAWLGGGTTSGGDTEKRKGYEFTRGDREGEREHSWAAIGRWAEDVGAHRWAQRNVICYVSDDELRAGAPALTINGDEPWLITPVAGWEWGRDRLIEKCTVQVLADSWGLLIGAVIEVEQGGPHDGRYLVHGTTGGVISPVLNVTLSRPRTKLLEPRSAESEKVTVRDVETGSTAEQRLYAACKRISDQGRAYVYGGGHGPALASIGAKAGLDCSSSSSLALKAAGMFPGNAAITSGIFAASWGQAGKGRSFTVWANAEHVWIEFANGHRFDTSPQGDGGSGPRLRTKKRNDQARFTARHWPGT